MFENIMKFFKKFNKKDDKEANTKEAAKERLHLVLMQDRANVSADFLELMKQEIIEVIKKYIEVDESAIDVRLTNKENEDGTNGAPALYANIPITNIKNDVRKINSKEEETKKIKDEKSSEKKENIENERIAKAIIEGGLYNEEKDDKNKEKKQSKKQEKVIVDDAKQEEDEEKDDKQDSKIDEKEEKIETEETTTKEESKSEN